MLHKKKDQPDKTPEQEALEKHVDAMMDPKQPDPETPEPPAATSEEPIITAVTTPADGGPSTAPQLSPKLQKQIGIKDVPTKPLSIDKLDELTEQITKSETPKETKKVAEKPKAAQETEDITDKSTDLDDQETDRAVDEIVAQEGDIALAVADSTADRHNREVTASAPKGHPVVKTVLWTFIAVVALLIVALGALLVMGDSLANKLGL